MLQFNSTIQEEIDVFQRDIIASERFYREAIAVLAVSHMMQQLERVPKPPRRRRLLWVPCRVLARGGRWLGRRLFSLAFRRRRRRAKTWHWEVSHADPIIIDVKAEPLDHRSQRFYSRSPSLITPLRQSQAGDHPSRWLLTGNPNEERSSDHE